MSKTAIDRAVAFHGDLCPGVANGVQAPASRSAGSG